MKFYKSGLESKSTFVFNESSFFAYNIFIGYNLRFGHTHLKNENISDRFMQISRIIRSIHRVFGVVFPFEDLLENLSDTSSAGCGQIIDDSHSDDIESVSRHYSSSTITYT